MAQTSNPESKDEVIKKLTTETKPLSVENVVNYISDEVIKNLKNNTPMPDVRKLINKEANGYASALSPEQKKELSLALRTKFERMRQFMEACHQEIIACTSQIGW